MLSARWLLPLLVQCVEVYSRPTPQEPTPSPARTSLPPFQRKHRPRPGLIIGVTIGSVVAAAIIVLAVLWYARRMAWCFVREPSPGEIQHRQRVEMRDPRSAYAHYTPARQATADVGRDANGAAAGGGGGRKGILKKGSLARPPNWWAVPRKMSKMGRGSGRKSGSGGGVGAVESAEHLPTLEIGRGERPKGHLKGWKERTEERRAVERARARFDPNGTVTEEPEAYQTTSERLRDRPSTPEERRAPTDEVLPDVTVVAPRPGEPPVKAEISREERAG